MDANRFEWDPVKARKNLGKHGVSFELAQTVFLDDLSISGRDPDHSFDEERRIILGRSSFGELLTVCFVERANTIRLISARKLTSREKRLFENG